ncbi:MAG: carbamoyl-phosphate synthase large subunit, partial [Rickettsiales bacterium]|nr:carbamoyl-phosphate synthase large subunit [Rickettsiales bacterium]
LFFEPLTSEDVISLIKREQENGTIKGVVVQLGGQTPLKLAKSLEEAGIPIIGTSPDAIDLAEDRDLFKRLLDENGLKQPMNDTAKSVEEVLSKAEKMGFPMVIRPSYVLGGRAMEIVYDMEALKKYCKEYSALLDNGPLLLDTFLTNATEVDVDVIADGSTVFVAGIMEHIEEAGIHSGDSACSLPPYSLSDSVIESIREQAKALAFALKVKGLMNVQFAVKDNDIYVLEVNPRASRTVPFVAKTIGVPVAKIASRVMAGEALADFNLKEPLLEHIAVKEAVFPFTKFPGVDVLLGPEMKSTGEVMGIDSSFPLAFAKSQIASGSQLPTSGTVFVSVKNADKEAVVEVCRELKEVGFDILATFGTAKYLYGAGIEVKPINKVLEGRPHVVDVMMDGGIDLVINTTEGSRAITDSFSIRRTALMDGIPYCTTISGAVSLVKAIKRLSEAPELQVRSIQKYLAN